jgi:hypothetical protein
MGVGKEGEQKDEKEEMVGIEPPTEWANRGREPFVSICAWLIEDINSLYEYLQVDSCLEKFSVFSQ